MFWSRKHCGHQRWRIPEIGSRGLTVPHRSGAPRGMFKPLESGPGVKITSTNHMFRESSWIVGLITNHDHGPNRSFQSEINVAEKHWQILTVFFIGIFRAPELHSSSKAIVKIMILDSTVLRAAMTDFIFPKAGNIFRMSSQRSVFFEGFLDATDPSIQSIN